MLYDITYKEYLADGLSPAKAFSKAVAQDLPNRMILTLQLIRNLFDLGLASSKKLVDALSDGADATGIYDKYIVGVLPSDCSLEQFTIACQHLLDKKEYGTLGRLLATHRNDDWANDYQMFQLLVDGTASIESLYLPGNATSNFRYLRID